jgi:hypothetical protein
MNVQRIIGSSWIRLACVVLALLSAAAFVAAGRQWIGPPGWVRFAGVVLGLLAAMAFVHAFRPVYAVWMRVAGVLNQVMTTLLFGLVYLVIVPPFSLVMRLVDPLRARRAKPAESLWIERPSEPVDADSLSRMT